MAKIGVEVEGLRETVRALERAGTDVADLKEVFSGIASFGARMVQKRTPTRSGKLRASVRGNKAKNKAVVAAGKKLVPYAGPINYGWRAHNIKPQHFMQKADSDIGPRAVDMLDDGLTEIVRKAGLE